MDLVLRPANDRFLQEVAFPAFTLGMTDARAALSALLEAVGDHRTRMLSELLIEHAGDAGLDALTQDGNWMELVYRLLFSEWADGGVGWQVTAEHPGYAGSLDAALHYALMIEHPDYPYAHRAEADAYRAEFKKHPSADFTLASLICGLWDAPVSFVPEGVLATVGRASSEGLVSLADWAIRDWSEIQNLQQRMQRLLERLLRRETERLPVEIPEVPEITAYWMGRAPEPPMLTVAFSGLGQDAAGWVREIGDLAAVVRNAARARTGLSALATGHSSKWDR